MKNIEQRTSNVERRIFYSRASVRLLTFGCGLWAVSLFAQVPTQLQPGMAAQVMIPQATADLSSLTNISATAEFDPPTVRAGEKTFYRVNVGATENSIEWPETIFAPPELKFGATARGQLMQPDGVKFDPLTAFVYEVTATAAGHFSISNFVVSAGGQRVEIPAANLEVLETNSTPTTTARKLILEISETNLFFGQPFRVRVILPAGAGNQIEALRDVQFNGGGFLTDKLSTRQSIETINRDGNLKPAFIYETVATPMSAGWLEVSAQAFTAGREFSGPVVISGQVTIPGGPAKYALLISDAVRLNVRPLPNENELPGFTGALGKFLADAPQLSTNKIHVGEPVKLKFNFHSGTNLTRFVPPDAPRSRDWQMIAGKPGENFFTLIPLTDEATNTPAIPFCAFDPATQNYCDLTIPAFAVTVIGESLPVQIAPEYADEKNPTPLKLSALAQSPGKALANLKLPQTRFGLISLQILPVFLLLILWRWDERKRFLEAHPGIMRRRKAKRDLRREKNKMQRAFAARDENEFARRAAAAMRIAVAPHFPADARAMVGGDVLAQFQMEEQNGTIGETVRKIFAAADAQFANSPQSKADLFALKSGLEMALQKLEEKL